MVMKKLINDPRNVVQELIEGFVLANEQSVYKHPAVNAVIRRGARVRDKVGIVIGGGAGHEPLFLEYVGRGMADAEAHGQIFAAPSPTIVLAAITAVDAGRGVMLLYNNYAGDVLNFDMAQERPGPRGSRSAPSLSTTRSPRRRAAGSREARDHVGPRDHQDPGAAAEDLLPLEEVVRVTEKAIAGSRSFGVALSSCTLPGNGEGNLRPARRHDGAGHGPARGARSWNGRSFSARTGSRRRSSPGSWRTCRTNAGTRSSSWSTATVQRRGWSCSLSTARSVQCCRDGHPRARHRGGRVLHVAGDEGCLGHVRPGGR